MAITITERHHHLSSLPRQIAVFPLREAILLPRSDLPLNVFEPRYLQMIDDVLGCGRFLGIIQPVSSGIQHGDGTQSPPGKSTELRRIGAIGRLTTFQETDDGRYIISISGIARFRVVDEVDTNEPYRICNVDYSSFVDDLVARLGEDDVDRAHLLKVLKDYLKANDLDVDWQAIENASNEFLVNSLSMISPYGAEEKQALLEAADLKERSEVLIALAEMDLAAPDDGCSSAIQ